MSIQVVTRRAIAPHEELTVRYLDWHTPLGGSTDAADSDEDVTPIAAPPKPKASNTRSTPTPKRIAKLVVSQGSEEDATPIDVPPKRKASITSSAPPPKRVVNHLQF